MDNTQAQKPGFQLKRVVFNLSGPYRLRGWDQPPIRGVLEAFLSDDWCREDGPRLNNFRLSKFRDSAAVHISPMPPVWVAVTGEIGYAFESLDDGGWYETLAAVLEYVLDNPLEDDGENPTVTFVPHPCKRLDGTMQYTVSVKDLPAETQHYINMEPEVRPGRSTRNPPRPLSERLTSFPFREKDRLDLSRADGLVDTGGEGGGSVQDEVVWEPDEEARKTRADLIERELEKADRWSSSPESRGSQRRTSPEPPRNSPPRVPEPASEGNPSQGEGEDLGANDTLARRSSLLALGLRDLERPESDPATSRERFLRLDALESQWRDGGIFIDMIGPLEDVSDSRTNTGSGS